MVWPWILSVRRYFLEYRHNQLLREIFPLLITFIAIKIISVSSITHCVLESKYTKLEIKIAGLHLKWYNKLYSIYTLD